jgi:hypothetical protein
MKRNIARKWAKALESGEYEQCKGQLRNGASFCTLGVLCNLHALEHPEIAATQKRKERYLGEPCVLPGKVQEWAGMISDYGYIDYRTSLVDLNDDHGKSFAEIAKVIRKEWKNL